MVLEALSSLMGNIMLLVVPGAEWDSDSGLGCLHSSLGYMTPAEFERQYFYDIKSVR